MKPFKAVKILNIASVFITKIKYYIQYSQHNSVKLFCVLAQLHLNYLFDLAGVLPDFTLTFDFALGRSEFKGVALDMGLRLEEVEAFASVFLFLVDTFPLLMDFGAVEAWGMGGRSSSTGMFIMKLSSSPSCLSSSFSSLLTEPSTCFSSVKIKAKFISITLIFTFIKVCSDTNTEIRWK